jgi:hypothetical protein
MIISFPPTCWMMPLALPIIFFFSVGSWLPASRAWMSRRRPSASTDALGGPAADLGAYT